MTMRYVGGSATIVALLIFVLLLGACVPIASEGAAGAGAGTVPGTVPAQGAGESFTDAFAYCAAVGTVDAPDARWAGDAQPAEVAEGLRGPLGTPADVSVESIQRTMVWRCVDGAVYACVVGANLPCSEQADLSTEPSEAVAEFCAQNPDNDFVPMAVTGRATAYAWSCADGEAMVGDQMMEVDAQGFFADIWYEVARP